MCPYARMNQRVGNLPPADEEADALNVRVATVQANYPKFGLSAEDFGYIIARTAAEQLRVRYN